MALRDYLVAVFAVVGYFVGAVLWDFVFSAGLEMFVLGIALLSIGAGVSAYLRKWDVTAFFVAGLAAQFTATYWL